MRSHLKVFCVAAGLAAAPLIGGGLPVQAQSIMMGGTIEEIVIEGSQRIEPATVRSYLGISPGEAFDPVVLDRALKNLFDTGLFANVTLERQGDSLLVEVVENPIINRIAFEGNRRIDDDSLQSEIELRPRIVYTRTRVQNDVRRILDLYRASGRFAATVEPKVIQRDQNRVDLVFEIDEGERTEINAVNFVGNEAFSDRTLRGEVTTKESAWWRFLSSADSYDPDRLSFDRELLRRFYLSEGYADFTVESAIAELTPDGEGFIVTFTVNEGERYRFGEVLLNSELRGLDPESVRGTIETEEGDWYDAGAVEDSVDALTEAIGDQGFAFIDVRPNVQRDAENRVINVTYQIAEGPRAFVERIDIVGNLRTLDRVIRREMRLVEGDAFNASKLRRSRTRIENLGFFRTVEVENVPGSQPDRTVLEVEVEEQSTGELSFGAGFSTSAGPIGTAGIRERNLLGRGQDVRLNFAIAGNRSQVDFSFTEPYFMDLPISAGVDVYRIVSEEDELTFEDERLGGGVRAGYNLSEHLRQTWRYTIEQRNISNIHPRASLAIFDEEGESLRSSVSHELAYDRLDSRLNPREGYRLFTTNTFAGLGGDVRYLRNVVGATFFQPLGDDFTLNLRGQAGHMFGIGKDTRVLDRFFIGGDTLRGFRFAGISPRDEATRDPLGAKQYYTATAELYFPLGVPDEFDMRGRVFTDVGSSWGVDNAPATTLDSNAVRASVGTGISWNSPLGPLELDFAIPVMEEDFDRDEFFRFSFGTRF